MRLRLHAPSLALGAAFAVAAVALSGISAVPVYTSRTSTVTEAGGTEAVSGGGGGSQGPGSGTVVRSGGGTAGLECAPGRNGGAPPGTPGVTENMIKLGATVVKTGIGQYFLSGAPVAMQAAVLKVNRAGGICGRYLDLNMVDDAWSRTQGQRALRSLIADGVFALAVSPSSEGVDALISGKELVKGGVPLVGADGMVKSMYNDPWVWPVATSTVSTMHIIALQAAEKGGAGTFGIVFDKGYRFGVEGARAFNTAVRQITGDNVAGWDNELSTCREVFCAIESGKGPYGTQAESFTRSCEQDNPKSNGGELSDKPSCDMIAYLLEPKTALDWLGSGGPANATAGIYGPQPLFNADFAKSCGFPCSNGWVVYTSYKPPLPPYQSDPAVQEYVATVRQKSPTLDVTNAFTEGAYLGMQLLIEAMRRAGPRLTRDALRQALNTGTYDLGLSLPLKFTDTDRVGSAAMLPYMFQFQGNRFSGFKRMGDWYPDRLKHLDLQDQD